MTLAAVDWGNVAEWALGVASVAVAAVLGTIAVQQGRAANQHAKEANLWAENATKWAKTAAEAQQQANEFAIDSVVPEFLLSIEFVVFEIDWTDPDTIAGEWALRVSVPEASPLLYLYGVRIKLSPKPPSTKLWGSEPPPWPIQPGDVMAFQLPDGTPLPWDDKGERSDLGAAFRHVSRMPVEVDYSVRRGSEIRTKNTTVDFPTPIAESSADGL